MTARRAKRTSTSKGPGTALRTTGTAFRTTPGGRASAMPKTQCRRPTPQRAVVTPPHGQAIGLRQRLIWLIKTPRPARAGDSPSTGPASPSAATSPHGQRRSADKNFSRTRFATLAHTPRRPQAAGATPSRRAFHAQRAWLCLFKIEASRSLYPRKRAGFERPATSGALATRGRRIDLAQAISRNFSLALPTLLSK